MSEQRLANIEREQGEILTLLKGLARTVQDRIDRSDQWRASIERTLKGDGNGYRGMLVRLDRLEQAAERQKWLVRTLVAAVATLAAQAVLPG